MEQLRGAVSNENSALIGLQGPQTKARATRSIYESFLNRATQLANVAGIQEQDASLVSAARVPLGPSAPQVARLLIVAAILSLVLGVALACLIERLRNGFSMPEQVEAALGAATDGGRCRRCPARRSAAHAPVRRRSLSTHRSTSSAARCGRSATGGRKSL